jgi:hypothetical protein
VVSKPFTGGAYAYQRLNLAEDGKAYIRNAKASNRTWEIRPSGIIGGPPEPLAMVEMRSHLAIERARLVTLHLQLARRSSIPTVGKDHSPAGADGNLSGLSV